MPVDYFAKRLNRLANFEFDVKNPDGTAVDLTGATVTYKIWSTRPGTTVLEAIAPAITTPTPTTGHVKLEWATSDLDPAGRYYGLGHIVFSSAKPIDVPTVGYHQILVEDTGPAA